MQQLTHRLRIFAHEHDDVPAFHAAYLVATFFVAAIFSLGYFGVLIALHMTLDFVKYRDYFHFDLPLTIKSVFLESIVDIALFFLSLTFGVYLSNDLGLVAVSGLLRSELTIARFLGGILPKIYIFEHILTLLMNFHLYLYTPHVDIRKPLSRKNRAALAVIVVSIAMLFASFTIFHGHTQELLQSFTQELSLKL